MKRKSQISLRGLAITLDHKGLLFPYKDNTKNKTFFFSSSEREFFLLYINPMKHISNIQCLVLFFHFLLSMSSDLFRMALGLGVLV